MRDAGLLGPHINVIHGSGLTGGWIATLVAAGVTFTSTPENEMGQGHGFPVTDAVRRHGGAISLGTDVDTVLSGELMIQARVALAQQRAVDHDRVRAATLFPSRTPTVTSREALAWTTVEGARALGIAERTGTIEPGKQADLIAIDARMLNLWPARDPLATLLHASLANIEAVMIDGVWRKRDHALVGVDLAAAKAAAATSGDRLMALMQLPGRAA